MIWKNLWRGARVPKRNESTILVNYRKNYLGVIVLRSNQWFFSRWIWGLGFGPWARKYQLNQIDIWAPSIWFYYYLEVMMLGRWSPRCVQWSWNPLLRSILQLVNCSSGPSIDFLELMVNAVRKLKQFERSLVSRDQRPNYWAMAKGSTIVNSEI